MGSSLPPSATASAFRLNGHLTRLDLPAAHGNLLDYLRARGLTGAKEGCAEGECGACAVVLTRSHGSGSQYYAVNSCLMPLASVAGHDVLTIEGLEVDGRLADAQAAMAAAGGSQCGYCTPGFVMSLFAEQYRPGRTGPCDPLAMAGNLCRCTGYRPIRDAAQALGAPPAGALLDRLARPTPPLAAVSASGFSRPVTVDAYVATIAAHPEATLTAGATDLCVDANIKGRTFEHLVSLEAIDELRAFVETPDQIRIGAALPLSEIGERWTAAPRAVVEWLELFASPLIRNRATLGGNLATASPIGDAAPLLLALDAAVEIAGASGRRLVALADFFVGYRRTALMPGELLTAVIIPKPLISRLGFYKIAKRRLDDISTVAAAFAVDVDVSGRVIGARLAFGGVAATPIRSYAAEEAIAGMPFSMTAVQRAQAALDATLKPMSDHRGSAEYRLAVAKSLVEKYWTEWRS